MSSWLQERREQYENRAEAWLPQKNSDAPNPLFCTVTSVSTVEARGNFQPYSIFTVVEDGTDKKWSVHANVADLRYKLTQGEVSTWNGDAQQWDNYGDEPVCPGEELVIQYRGLVDSDAPAGPENKHRFTVDRLAFHGVSSSSEFGAASRKLKAMNPEPPDEDDDIPY